MDFGHSKACEQLALWAGREVGLDPLSPAAVAESPDAREVRDAAWGDYRRRLADRTTYTLEAIRAWLAEHAVDVSIASVQRDRAPILAKEERLRLGSEITRRFLKETEGAGTAEVLQAGLKRVAQVLFETSLRFEADELRDSLEGGDFVRLAEAVGKLCKANSEVGLIDQRVAELREKARKAVAAAPATADGRVTREDVFKILDDVMKGKG